MPTLRSTPTEKSRRSRRRAALGRRAASLAAVIGVMLVLLAAPGSAQLDGEGSSFTATASARLVAVDFRLAPTIGFDPLLDPGQSVAQAQLDSLGVSKAYAANSYPGATVLGLPGLIGFATDGAVGSEDIPAYPLYAQSSYPTESESHVAAGLYQLSAVSSPVASTGRATDGSTSGTASATADPATGDVVAQSESTVAGFRVSEALTVHGVRSAAEVRQSTSGDLERSSTFEISALTILGQRVAVTPDGLAILDQDAPLGDGLSGTLEPLLAGLEREGITIDVFPAAELEDGVMSGGMRISVPIEPPEAGVERVTAVFTLGAVSASVSNRALPAFDVGAVAAPPAADEFGASSEGGSGGLPPSGTTVSDDLGSVPSTDSGPDNEVTAQPEPVSSVVSAIPVDVSIIGFYPVLALAGAVLYGAARLFSYLEGRTS